MVSLWNLTRHKAREAYSYVQHLSVHDSMEHPHIKLFDKQKNKALSLELMPDERLELVGYQGATSSGRHKQPLIYDYEWLKKKINKVE